MLLEKYDMIVEGKIAAFLNRSEIVINRGLRNGVVPLSFCIIKDDKNALVALLGVCEVREKITIARAIWCSEQCPTLSKGHTIFIMEIP